VTNWDASDYPFELPVDGSQDSVFLKMGMDFGPFGPKDSWRGAHLPEGWRIEKVERLRSYVLDEHGRPRAVIHKKDLIHMRPLRRFNYGRADPKNPDESVRFCLWDAGVPFPDKRKVIFEEIHTVPSRKQHKAVHDNRADIYYNIFETRVKKWLADKYPNWERYYSHWDEEDEPESNQEEENGQEDQPKESTEPERSVDANQGEAT